MVWSARVNENAERIIKEVARYGISVTKSDIEKEYLESKRFKCLVKEKLVKKLNDTLNTSNDLILTPPNETNK